MTLRRVSRGSPPAHRHLPTSAVAHEWGRRVEAEYRSAAITHHVTLWLLQLASSPDLVHDGLRIVADELDHAELSHAVYVDAGGDGLRPIARETLSVPVARGETLEAALTRVGVEVFCLGETVAVPLFKVLREGCTVPSARRALDRILRDEVRHREFGWSLLDHLLELPSGPLVRALVLRELPAMFSRLRRSYAPVGGEAESTLEAAERAWGLMPTARYAEILARTFERDYRRRFADRGIDAEPAWAAALGRAGEGPAP